MWRMSDTCCTAERLFAYVNFFKLWVSITFSVHLLQQIWVCLYMCVFCSCHGDILACKYGQHTPCDNSHMTVLEEGFLFVRFLFIVLAVESICLYWQSDILLCSKQLTVLAYFCTSVYIYIYFVGFHLISYTVYVRNLSFNKTVVFGPCVLKLCT